MDSDQISDVDRFLANESKVLDGFQPHWTHAKGYRDYQLAWPISEEDTGRTRAHLRFRLPDQDFRFPSISLIFRGQNVARVDQAPPEVCKPNHPAAQRLGLPHQVCGPHFHSWEDNREIVRGSEQWHLPVRRPIHEELNDLDAMFFWFCSQTNVRIEAHNRPILLPDAGLFGIGHA
ncbi:hypothetical protein [Sinisalibacter lacisalsi]|uniref:hypothetical protein n=1 Tax=Sinisalibacter lacisalsi TaxID=1526570 RepID=UPI00166626A6|nr:hypothetical protein [Sinisalibacter lacisalsi]